MEKYLGGDDEPLKGFYDSDEEAKLDEEPKAGGSGLFGRLTSAFQGITGNKQLTREDMEPILQDFSKSLMDKNVAQEVAEDICR